MSALGTGAAPIEVAIAVSLSGVRLLPMVVTLLPMLRAAGHAAARSAAADAFHLGEHVGGIAAAAAGAAARAPHRLLQRLVGRLHGRGGERRLLRLLPRRRAAAAVCRRAAVSHADVVSGVDRAQRAGDDGQARAGARPGAGNGADRQPRAARSAVGRRRRRHARLCHSPLARGAPHERRRRTSCGPISCWCCSAICRTRSGACSAWCWRAG